MGVGGVSSDGLECLFARFALFHVLQYFAFLLRWASMNHGLKMNWSGRPGFEPATSASRTQRCQAELRPDDGSNVTNTPNRFGRASSIRLAKKAVFFRYELSMNKTITLFDLFALLGLQDEENARTVQEPAQAPVSTEETISMAEHDERLLGEAEAATEAMGGS